MTAGKRLNLAFFMLLIRLVDGRKAHLGARRHGAGMTQSIMQSNLNVTFGNNVEKGHKK